MQPHLTEDIQPWNRWFAMESSNLAWTLAEKSDRAAAEGEEIPHAAHASALTCSAAGAHLVLGIRLSLS